MLITYYGNRLENLADRLAATIASPLASPFAEEIVVVQSNGMARWLCLHLARELGVCANIRFPFPASFIWEMYRKVLDEVPETSAFDAAVLTWRLMDQLRVLEDTPTFKPLQDYLRGEDLRCYELAARIADNYDQYLVYRPDWIARWESGSDEHWQAELWRRLTADGGVHRAHLRQRFLDTLDAETAARAELPSRVSFVGISALPPAYLDILSRLAEFTDVHLFLLNPCREYWGDIVAEREVARLGAEVDPEQLYLEVGNPLLASLGKLGRDFIDLIQGYPAQVVEDFREPAGEGLLHCLQSDILNLRTRGDGDFPKTPLRSSDRSVQVHACHSPMREVEVLYDQLLALFHADPDLQPSAVVVMTPDIEVYAPLVEAVFATAEGDRYIPFSIADRGLRAESPIVEVFFALLDLHGSRFDANRVLALLENEAVRRRFGFLEGDLAPLQRWVRETGIRWGLDAHNRAALDLPALQEHTWRLGLDRLLLGYALPGGNARLLADILPYDEVEGADAQIMGRLHSFAEAVFQLDADLAGRQPLSNWSDTLGDLLERFLDPLDEEEVPVQVIRNALEAMAQSAEQAGFREPVSLEVAESWLRRHLDQPEGLGHFISGGVTFCTLVPMRSIPFQVVCLIGMNSDSYPRPYRRLGFDLMARHFRRGDRSRRKDDRYLFLESLLSARRCLYLSYVGNDIRDNSVIPPSVLVSELLDVIGRGFYSEDGEDSNPVDQIVTRHPLQAFSRRYFVRGERLFSYSEELREAALRAGRGGVAPTAFIAEPLSAPSEEWRTVDLSRLIRFFANPTRYLLRYRMGIHLTEGEGGLPTREPFILDPIEEQRLREDLLSLRLSGEFGDQALAILRAGGKLPHGQVGENLFERERADVERFAGRLARFLPAETLNTLDVDLHCGFLRLTGQLGGVTPRGLVGYRLAKVRPKDYLDLWIRHLVLNALAPPGIGLFSHWLGRDRELVLRPTTEAKRYLEDLMACYWQGLQRPLHFFPRSALAYIDASVSPNAKTSPETAAARTWRGSDFYLGEREDPYYQLVFRGADPLDESFLTLTETVLRPLFQHLEEEA